jgi:hypothetical protein
MNKRLLILAIFVCLTGCKTSLRTVAYTTLYGLETGVTGSYDEYMRKIVAGQLPTNNVPVISRKYDNFQHEMLDAEIAAQFSTNALATAALRQDGQFIIDLINTVK